MITRRLGVPPGSHAITLNVGEFGQFAWTKGSRRTCSPLMALYWLNRKSRAAVTPWPGWGSSEQDWRVVKFCSVCAVPKMLLELTLLMIAFMSGSVVIPELGTLGARLTNTTAKAPTSSQLPLISIRFIEVSFVNEVQDWGIGARGRAQADTGIAGTPPRLLGEICS